MKFKFKKNFIIMGLSLGLFLARPAFAEEVNGLGKINMNNPRPLTPEIMYHHIGSTNSFGPQNLHQIDFNYTNSPVKAKVLFGPYLKGGDRLSVLTKEFESKGNYVVFGINGDSYLSDGVPKGCVISDGILETTGASYMKTLGFTKDKKLVYGFVNPIIHAKIGGINQAIYSINKDRLTKVNPVHIYTSSFAPSFLEKDDHIEITVKMEDGFKGIKIGSTLNGSVIKVEEKSSKKPSSSSLNEGELVVTASKKSIHYKDLKSVKKGDSFSVDTRAFGDSIDWQNVDEAIGVFIPMLENGKKNEKYYNLGGGAPRTLFAKNDEGKVTIIAADGRQKPHAAGLSLAQSTDYLSQLGYKDIYDFDGGGSTTIMIRKAWEDAAKMRNIPSDKGNRERYNGNALVFYATENLPEDFVNNQKAEYEKNLRGSKKERGREKEKRRGKKEKGRRS